MSPEADLGLAALQVIWIWVACLVAGWYAGARHGAPRIGLAFGLFFGPLGVAIAWLMPGKRVGCDFCRELVLPSAKVCPHCHREHPISATTRP